MGNLRQCAFVAKGDYTGKNLTLKVWIPERLDISKCVQDGSKITIHLNYKGSSSDTDEYILQYPLKEGNVDVEILEGAEYLYVDFELDKSGVPPLRPKKVGSSLLVSV